ncbi:hypothetical protein BaRGS_00039997 [Batillaria attramentaria]|uniref:Uncharacterized protein n=1 Tax=Batillaria attramentaria TaxID=370345 RepID=A0ABD0J1R5_9CAEN
MGSLKSTGGLSRVTGMGEEERFVWLLGMPACTEICAAMQHLTGVRYSGNEQHIDMSKTRQEKDHADTKKIVVCLQQKKMCLGVEENCVKCKWQGC